MLKVKDLKELIKNANDEDVVVVAVKDSMIGGGTPSSTINHAIIGFDWNYGKVILYPNQDLKIMR